MFGKNVLPNSLLALLLITLAAFSGCSPFFDHSAYVGALLDAYYKAEFAEYLAMTESGEAEALEQYNKNMDNVVADMGEKLLYEFSEEQREKLKAVVKRTFAAASYEVLEAKKIEGSRYSVQIKILPVTNFRQLSQGVSNFAGDFLNELYASDLEGLNPDDVYKDFINGVIAIIEDETEIINYGEEITVTVPVVYNPESKEWYIPEREQQKLFIEIIQL